MKNFLLRARSGQAISLIFASFLGICLMASPIFALQTPEPTPEVAPCTVHTDTRNSVQVRVGPGTNRGVFAFLPANQDFDVLGQATADNGSLWWKLDRPQVAPRSMAAEAWVLQSDVDTSGDCGTIETAIPPTLVLPGEVGGPLGKLIAKADASLCNGATSAEIAAQSWGAGVDKAAACVQNMLKWQTDARQQQAARVSAKICAEQPAPSDLDAYFKANWALTDLATGYYNLGLALKAAGQTDLARSALQTVTKTYSCAWAWDNGGWFWSLSEGAAKALQGIS